MKQAEEASFVELTFVATANSVAYCGAVPHFVDETDAAGIQSRFDGDWEYMVGGGVAALDCDGNCGVCPHNSYCPCVNPVVARSKTALRLIELRPILLQDLRERN